VASPSRALGLVQRRTVEIACRLSHFMVWWSVRPDRHHVFAACAYARRRALLTSAPLLLPPSPSTAQAHCAGRIATNLGALMRLLVHTARLHRPRQRPRMLASKIRHAHGAA
jgi:hypothetical protein